MTEPLPKARFTLGRMMIAVAVVAGALGAVAAASRSAPFGRFCWYAESALEIGTLIPWTPWVGGAGLLLGLGTIAIDRRLWRARTVWLAAPFLLPVLILLVGMAFRHTGAPASPPHAWLADSISLSPWLHVPIALLLIVRFPRAWPATIGLSAAAWYASFGASVIAWMSVTNIWL